MNILNFFYNFLTAETTTLGEQVQETVSRLAEATAAAPEATEGKGILIYIITAAAVVVGIALVVVIFRLINIAVYNKRVALRKKLIAMENDNDIKTVVLDVFSGTEDRIEAAGSQVLGTRQNQQDSYYISSGVESFDLLKSCYVAATVCDGMGGLSGGEIASQIAISCVEAGFKSFLNNPKGKSVKTLLKEVAIDANNNVCKYGAENGEANRCGTTMVFALMENNDLYWVSVGDSRIYVVRGTQIMQITHDHNYGYTLKQKVEQGLITQEEANTDPNREALISYIGKTDLELIDLSLNPIKLKKGDVVLLCSDGLTKLLTDAEIRNAIVGHMGTTQELADYLTMLATDMRVSSQDNTTVVVMTYK